MRDIAAAQAVFADLVLDDVERRAWEDDPVAYAAARLGPTEAAMVAGLEPRGIAAMSLSHVAKRERWDYYHRLRHEHEHRKAALEGAAHRHEHGDGAS